MTDKSEVSYSRRSEKKDSAIGIHRRSRDGETRVKRLLSQSLAICLTKIKHEHGGETADEILKILRDDLFDLKEFQKEITNLEKCKTVTNAAIGKRL